MPNGAFSIAIEMSNEKIPNLFKEYFQGSIYERKRDNRKKTWIWKINSINDQAIFFIKTIKPFCVIKSNQLDRLGCYLDQTRQNRKLFRSDVCSSIKNLKQPIPLELKNVIPRIKKPIEPWFYEWFAGFIDGDGNFVCNEYLDKRNEKKYFSHQISVANIFLEAICFINDRIMGCITNLNRNKNPLYKWVCNRSEEKSLCESIQPFLKLKNGQCDLFLQFLEFPKKSYGVEYSIEDRLKMYEIINEIKHLNSL